MSVLSRSIVSVTVLTIVACMAGCGSLDKEGSASSADPAPLLDLPAGTHVQEMAWSPDGKLLAVLAVSQTGGSEIRLVNGSNITKLSLDLGDVSALGWSTDATLMLSHERLSAHGSMLAVVDTQGTILSDVAIQPKVHISTGLSVLPGDDALIASIDAGPQETRLVSIRVQDGAMKPFPELNLGVVGHPRVVGDRRVVALVYGPNASFAHDNDHLEVISDGEHARLTPQGLGVQAFDVSRGVSGGDVVVFVAFTFTGRSVTGRGIYQVPLEGGVPERIADGEGAQVVAINASTLQASVVFYDSSTGGERIVTMSLLVA